NTTGHKAAFVAKLDTSGNFLWVQPFLSTSGDATTWGIAVDASGYVYATGYYTGLTSFGSTTLTSAGDQDVFVAKLDSGGNTVWAQGVAGPGGGWGFGVVPDTAGNVYVTGRFSNTGTFGSFSLTSTSTGGTNAFVTRLDASGNFQWARRMGGE